MNNAMTYSVYKTLSGLYVAEEICEIYNVGDETNKKTIKGIPCYKVNEQDINTISETARSGGEQLIADIVTIFDLQLVLSFTVYRDTNHDNKLYVLSNTCDKYNIKPISKRIIKNQTYYNVSKEDIAQIELKTTEEKIAYKRKYVDIALNDEIRPAEYLFICYIDSPTKKCYIKRDMYELIRKNNIEIEGEPKIIYNKNCYSITENELKEAEEKLNYRRVEQLLKPKSSTKIAVKNKINEVNFPKVENIQKVIDNAREFAEKIKEKRDHELKSEYNDKLIEYLNTIDIKDDDPTDDVEQFKEELKRKLDTIIKENQESEKLNTYNNKIKKIMDTIVIEDDDPTDDEEQYKEELKRIIDTIVIEDPKEYEEKIKKIMDTIVIEDDVDEYKDELKRIMDTIVIEDDEDTKTEYNEKIKKIMDSIVIDDVDEYKDELKRIMDTIVIDDEPKEKLIIYRDKTTDTLYEPIDTTETPEDTVVIMHKQCREITEEELETKKDKKIIIISVYPVDKKEYEIIVCNNNGQLFISKENLEDLGFYIENPHKIIVNKEIYEEINEDDLELIKAKESDSCHIDIIMKQIAPKRG